MGAHVPVVEYLATSRIGEKGQVTVPKQYRDELGLGVGDPVAALRIGAGLVLIPGWPRFQRLGDSSAEVLASAGVPAAALQASLPEARNRVFARRYPRLSRAAS